MLIVLNTTYLINHNIKWKQKNQNQTYYFYNIINLDEFDVSKIKVDKKDLNDINIYYLGYEYKKKITECNIIKVLIRFI